MFRKAGIIIGGLAFAASLAATTASALELKYLSSWTPNNKGTWGTEQMFMRMVQEESKGRLTVRRSGPEAVPAFEQLQPVGAGVFDILITHGAYHAGTTAIGMALDGINGDPAKRRETGIWEFANKHYQKFGVTTLAFVPQGKSGYQIILRDAIGPDGTLKGRKIRGTQTYHPLLKALGASPVVLAPTDVYTALEKGVVDGAAWPSVGVVDMKWPEVAKHYVQPFFGVSTLQLFINTNTFNRLSAEDKKVLQDIGRKMEVTIWNEYDKMAIEEIEGMKKAGMREARLSKELEGRLGSLFADGVWDLALAKNKGEAETFRKLVNDKGMGL
jgi:TRAP-type C4-dicarboxylate transport system substrate-binding protein